MTDHIKNSPLWYWIAGTLLAVALIEPVVNTDSGWSTVNPWAVIAGIVALGIALWRRGVESAKARANASAAAIEEHQRRLAEHLVETGDAGREAGQGGNRRGGISIHGELQRRRQSAAREAAGRVDSVYRRIRI